MINRSEVTWDTSGGLAVCQPWSNVLLKYVPRAGLPNPKIEKPDTDASLAGYLALEA